MAFSKEIEEEIRLDREQQKREWDAMTEEEREKIRRIGRRFGKKVASCYPPDADYSYSPNPIS